MTISTVRLTLRPWGSSQVVTSNISSGGKERRVDTFKFPELEQARGAVRRAITQLIGQRYLAQGTSAGSGGFGQS